MKVDLLDKCTVAAGQFLRMRANGRSNNWISFVWFCQSMNAVSRSKRGLSTLFIVEP